MRLLDSLAMKRRLPPAMVVGAIGVLGLVLVTLAVMVERGFDEAQALRGEVIRSYETRSGLQRILSLHQDLETSQRGYQITGNAAFLEPYSRAARQIDSGFDRLDRTLLAQSDLRPELANLRRLSQAKKAFVDEVIGAVERGELTQAQALVTSGRGKVAMDDLRAAIAGMDESERAQLSLRSERAEDALTWARHLNLGLSLSLFVVLAVAIWLAARSFAEGTDALRRLEDNRLRLAAILNGAQDGMIVINPSGSIESVNPAVTTMLGYSEAELVRRDIGLLFEVAPDRGRIETFLKRLEAGREGRTRETQEFVAARKDGSTFPAEVAVSPVRRADSTAFLAVFRDISERKQVEEMKSSFVSTVSHELRTPLTSIAGSLGLLAGGAAGSLPERAQRLVEIAQNNCARLVRLINDILDIEKIESGKMRFDIREVPLASFLEQAIQANRGFAQEHSVELRLAEIPANALVQADEDRLMQVVTNLISNAAKFSPEGETVEVSVTPLDRRFRISVADRGPGISDDFKERIFGKFAQSDSSITREKGGTGLGLSIVRELVSRMRGTVSFDSEPGRGTTFHVDLPAATPAPAVSDPTERPVRADDDRQLRILHVDDDADMLRIVASSFADSAYVYSSPSVVEARAGLLRQHYDAVILDIGLKDGSGLDLIPVIRAAGRTIPIVVFTAQDVAADEVAGADIVLVKSRASLDTLRQELLRRISENAAKGPE